MDSEQEAIYEIFRACRLCGAGAGYKMPIIQNVLDAEGSEIELRQKIQECIQIEVHQDDKMPPLICELCVDKVNDFYEFLEMCRQTNKKTRIRLGLPPQTSTKGTSDSSDCILGMTEPVYINEDSNEPLSKKKKNKHVKIKKEPELQVKVEKYRTPQRTNTSRSRSTRTKSPSPSSPPSPMSSRSPSPPRRRTRNMSDSSDNTPTRRQTRNMDGDDVRRSRTSESDVTPKRQTRNMSDSSDCVALSKVQNQSKKAVKAPPKSILKKEKETKEEASPQRSKRPNKPEPPKPDVPAKKVKLSISHSKSKSRESPPRAASPPPAPATCEICNITFKNEQAKGNHMRTHTVTFTAPRMSCNACMEWFSSVEQSLSHHRRHKQGAPYRCRHCFTDFKSPLVYDGHFEKLKCALWYEVPDVQCPVCWRYYPTETMKSQHRCQGEDGRPGGKCSKCNRPYTLLKNLIMHESMCKVRRRGDDDIDPELLAKVRPIQIRVARCDDLLEGIDPYDVSDVPWDYGLDKNSYYPYISGTGYKSGPSFTGMVKITDDVKDLYSKDINWDSDASNNSDTNKKTPKTKNDIDFDNIKTDINNIIDNLNDDDDKDVSSSHENVNNDVKKHDESNAISENDKDSTDSTKVDLNSLSNDAPLHVNKDSIGDNDKVKLNVAGSTKNNDVEKNENNKNDSDEEIKYDRNTESEKETSSLNTENDDSQDGNENKNEAKINEPEVNDKVGTNGEIGKSDEQIDDKSLMDAIDAQIGDDKVENDKITMNDLVPKKATDGMDLDSISEEDYFE